MNADASNRVVAFDIGGTLADLHQIATATLRAVLSRPNLTVREIVAAIGPEDGPAFSSFFLNESVLVRMGTPRANVLAVLEEYRKRALDAVEAQHRRESSGCLAKLVEAGATVILVTNGSVVSTKALLTALGIRDLASQVYVSEAYGVVKHTGILHRQVKADYPGMRITMVGDSVPEDIVPALENGLEAIWISQYSGDSFPNVPSRAMVVANLRELVRTLAVSL